MLIASVLALGLLGMPPPGQQQPQAGCPTGTFLQLTAADATRTADQWQGLLEELTTLDMSVVVVQWTVHDQTRFFSTTRRRRSEPPAALEHLLHLADERGMKVWVGLIEDPQFWNAIAGDAAQVGSYLRATRERTARLLDDLSPLVAKHRSFAGWYISQEIDDVNWRTPEARRLLLEHVRALTTQLKAALRSRPQVAISAFSNAAMDPEALAHMWRSLFLDGGIDVLLFQDGVGTGKLQLAELPPYLAALRRAADSTGRVLRVVVELFRQTSGAPIDQQPFAAVPAPVERVRDQMELARQFSTEPPVTFSAPNHMVPSAGALAAQLHQAYTRDLSARCR